MTLEERAKPELLKASRKQRIAKGAGVQVQEVNRLPKQFEQMQGMMKQFQRGGMQKMMRALGGLGGLGNMMRGGGMPSMPDWWWYAWHAAWGVTVVAVSARSADANQFKIESFITQYQKTLSI